MSAEGYVLLRFSGSYGKYADRDKGHRKFVVRCCTLANRGLISLHTSDNRG